MPLTFPSHQGLILPVRRWFPDQIDGLTLCVGAAMPDIVDAAAWPCRGELGQWIGHSLLGILVCIPASLGVAWILRRIVPSRFLAPVNGGSLTPDGYGLGCVAAGLGAVSHLLFDLITHGNFRLLWPWYSNDHLFPSWWYHEWAEIPLFVYRDPYPFAPHTIAWILLTLVGAVLLAHGIRGSAESPGT